MEVPTPPRGDPGGPGSEEADESGRREVGQLWRVEPGERMGTAKQAGAPATRTEPTELPQRCLRIGPKRIIREGPAITAGG